MRRQLEQDLVTVDTELALLRSINEKKRFSAPTLHERIGFVADVLLAGVLAGPYGYARTWALARWRDVTPSTARELASHVGKRTAVGTMLLIAGQEGMVYLKRERFEDVLAAVDAVRTALGLGDGAAAQADGTRDPSAPRTYTKETLNVLVTIDLANILLLGVVNFCFPYCILPSLLHPLQFALPPTEPSYPMPEVQAAPK
jgi:hypothetical protein